MDSLSSTLGSDSDGKYMQATVTGFSSFEGMGHGTAGVTVGGESIPVNKLAIVAPYLTLIGLLGAVSTVYALRRRSET